MAIGARRHRNAYSTRVHASCVRYRNGNGDSGCASPSARIRASTSAPLAPRGAARRTRPSPSARRGPPASNSCSNEVLELLARAEERARLDDRDPAEDLVRRRQVAGRRSPGSPAGAGRRGRGRCRRDQGAARLEHAVDLGQRPLGVEPVERRGGRRPRRPSRPAAASPRPSPRAPRRPGPPRRAARASPASGSTAITARRSGRAAAVSLPVPAPTSTTVAPGPSPSRSASQRTAAAGYSGRRRS